MKPGSVLDGKYELRRRIGNGAMGALWEGLNTRTEREVAVKLLASRGREEDRQRLLREARAGGRIRHPNVLDVYDVSETDDGSPFIVMELLSGETLAARLEKGPLELGKALRTLRDVARGLGAAHKVGVVHRNLKPHNVFLHTESDASEPTVKLVEFGISRIDAEETLTLKGVTLGSPGYVAPEQIDGRAVDARADVWAFGSLAYELLSGHVLFDGTTPAEILVQVTAAPIPELPSITPELDADLRALVAGCLKRDPNERFASIAECTTLLDRVLDRLSHPSMARVAERRPRGALDDDEPTTITSNADPPARAHGRAPLSSDTEDPIPTLHYKREAKAEAKAEEERSSTHVSVTEGTPIDAELDLSKTPLEPFVPPDEDTDGGDGEPATLAMAPPSDDEEGRENEDEPTRPTSTAPPAVSPSNAPSASDAPRATSSAPPRSPTVPPLFDPSAEQSRRKVQMFQEALAPEESAAPVASTTRSASRIALAAAAFVALGLVILLATRASPPAASTAAKASASPIAESTASAEATSARSDEAASAAPPPDAPVESAAPSTSASSAASSSSASPKSSSSPKATRPRVVRATPKTTSPAPPSTGAVYNPSSL